MDPITQGTLGSALSQSFADRQRLRGFAVSGMVGGLAPDLDFFIRSSADPLLYFEYHRQFTHALIFIPFGAALCAAVVYWFVRKRLSWQETWLACLLGYATHGLLDACTSYGTQLLWPFSDARVSWNWISVVDPLFTLPLLVFAVAGFLRQQRVLALLGLVWAVLYMSIGIAQHQRAGDVASLLASERGHHPVRLTIKPAFANLLLWKSVYEHGDRYYVDAIRAGWVPEVCEGDSIGRLKLTAQLPWLDLRSQQHRDLERFRWYSDDWLAIDREDPLYVVDVRYSSLPNRIDALWGLRLDPRAAADAHTRYHVMRSRRTAAPGELAGLLAGSGCRLLTSAAF